VRSIVVSMSLAQKIGQMTQAEIKSITPAEVRKYYIGSVLNGGGSWPGDNKHARIDAWLALSDAYCDASMATDAAVKIPIISGTNAVHGDNNVFGATLFPHNTGLGAADGAANVTCSATAQASVWRTPAAPGVQANSAIAWPAGAAVRRLRPVSVHRRDAR
jgi:beta-glucosidase